MKGYTYSTDTPSRYLRELGMSQCLQSLRLEVPRFGNLAQLKLDGALVGAGCIQTMECLSVVSLSSRNIFLNSLFAAFLWFWALCTCVFVCERCVSTVAFVLTACSQQHVEMPQARARRSLVIKHFHMAAYFPWKCFPPSFLAWWHRKASECKLWSQNSSL